MTLMRTGKTGFPGVTEDDHTRCRSGCQHCPDLHKQGVCMVRQTTESGFVQSKMSDRIQSDVEPQVGELKCVEGAAVLVDQIDFLVEGDLLAAVRADAHQPGQRLGEMLEKEEVKRVNEKAAGLCLCTLVASKAKKVYTRLCSFKTKVSPTSVCHADLKDWRARNRIEPLHLATGVSIVLLDNEVEHNGGHKQQQKPVGRHRHHQEQGS